VTSRNFEHERETLDDLLAVVDRHPEWAESSLLREHLQTAYGYLRGAMPEEYALNLGLALRVVDRLPDGEARDQMRERLTALTEHPSAV
jgi:hypothetical protein